MKNLCIKNEGVEIRDGKQADSWKSKAKRFSPKKQKLKAKVRINKKVKVRAKVFFQLFTPI